MNATPRKLSLIAVLTSLLASGAAARALDPPRVAGSVGTAAPVPVATVPSAEPSHLGKDLTAQFNVPEGLEVKVWAESPQFYNPTDIDIDARGRIWVAEAVNYRRPQRKSKVGDGYLYHPKGDRVMVLEDTNGDGIADKSTVFVEDPDLVAPLGIAVIGNKVIVSDSPSIIVYTDTDGDDKADKKEVFLTGFGGKDHDHGAHAITFGPDGKWYFAVGNEGPHLVKDHGGFTYRNMNPRAGKPAPASDDGHVWQQGTVLRINPDGTGLKVLANNFRNNYEVALDAFGSMWQNDNDDDGNQSCKLTYVLEGGSYGYVSRDGSRGWRADRRAGQSLQAAHFHQDDPGTIPATEFTGAGAPTGVVIYEGHLLPAKFRGAVFNADAGRSSVWAHLIKSVGANYTTERIDLIAAKKEYGDEARRFRPSDVAVGPDGAVYVSDWYDPIVGGHGMKDKVGYGRIFRIAPKGAVLKVPAIDTSSTASAIEALLNPAVNVRYFGWQALHTQGAAALPGLKDRLKDKDPRVRARLLWLAAGDGDEGRKLVEKALRDKDPDVRVAAFRALRGNASDFLPYVTILANDPSPVVRREVAVALRDVPVTLVEKQLLTLASRYDGKDRMYLEALGLGMEGKEEILYPRLLAQYGKGDPIKWSPRMTGFAWRLHPLAAIGALRARASSSALPEEAREQAVVALAFIKNAEAADAVLTLAEKGTEPLKSYALDLAFDRAGSEWQAFGVQDRLLALQSGRSKGPDQSRLEPYKAVLTRSGAKREEKVKAIEALAADKDGGSYLISLGSQGKLTPELKEMIAESIFKNPDVGVRALASQYFARPAFEGAAFPPVADLMKMKGDAKHGRQVFFSDQAACTKCHEYDRQGHSVGPALTLISGKLGRDAIFDSILNPSAAIAFGYDPWVIMTKDQQTYTGFLMGDGDTVLLKEVSGESRLIPAKNIVAREKEKTSIMPDNIALGMKPQDLVDLVEFLATGPTGQTGPSGKQSKEKTVTAKQ